MVVGGIGIALALLGFLFSMLGMGMAGMEGFEDLEGAEFMAPFMSGTVQILSNLISLAAAAFMIYAGMQMRQLNNWGLALAGTIVAMIPCISPCCGLIGIPIGIWALVILLKPEVKTAFS
jgi:hypothetical protein